jgi:hypothetical protein
MLRLCVQNLYNTFSEALFNYKPSPNYDRIFNKLLESVIMISNFSATSKILGDSEGNESYLYMFIVGL